MSTQRVKGTVGREEIPERPCPHCPDCKILTPYRCFECGALGLASMADGTRCVLCGSTPEEPFNAGWDK